MRYTASISAHRMPLERVTGVSATPIRIGGTDWATEAISVTNKARSDARYCNWPSSSRTGTCGVPMRAVAGPSLCWTARAVNRRINVESAPMAGSSLVLTVISDARIRSVVSRATRRSSSASSVSLPISSSRSRPAVSRLSVTKRNAMAARILEGRRAQRKNSATTRRATLVRRKLVSIFIGLPS